MASLKEYQDYKTYQESFRKMVGTLLSLEKDCPPCISPQVASTMEVSSHCIPCVLIRTSHIISYPKTTPNSTTTILSGGARGMGSGPGSRHKTQER
ncbi:hypothetical protein O181_034599 [Austropuccinia psidii MF-1]|uniref:Uncharacterized protein n=1 Tax=Austropuccinia psidii MF-1 TaxID=1389203 RepID=A0A9Q3D135_9BASI|nr:hypothetical protein [Austropuccinia psidii MF-1]